MVLSNDLKVSADEFESEIIRSILVSNVIDEHDVQWVAAMHADMGRHHDRRLENVGSHASCIGSTPARMDMDIAITLAHSNHPA